MNIKSKYTLSALRTAVVALFLTAFLCRCATMMTPSGGPLDTLPPVIVSMLPDNNTTNFDAKKIYIQFDEFVQIKDPQKEFFTSPQMKKKPQVSLSGRGIVVQIKDTLKENTTYALNFGSSIRDNNEGNPLYSMRYVFSTGSTIDSMICSGYTEDAYKADSVGKSFIYFFMTDSIEQPNEYDSVIFKYKPAVIGRAETNGIFIAQNLKPVSYRIYAFQDNNDNQMYDPSIDKVGFLETAHNPAELPDFGIWYDSIRRYVTSDPQLYFRMFTDVAFNRQMLRESQRPLQHKAILHFGAAHPQIKSISLDSIPSDRVIIDPQTPGRDTIALWFNMPAAQLPDTIRGQITYLKHDSVRMLQEVTEKLELSWRYLESKDEQRAREKLEKDKAKSEAEGEEWIEPKKPSLFKHNIPLNSEINPENGLAISFEYPLSSIDSTAIVFTMQAGDNSVVDKPIHFIKDTANILKWTIKSTWETASKYTLTIPPGTITDITGEKNDSIVANYTVSDPEKYAIVLLNVKGRSDTTKYVIQLLDGNSKLLQEKKDVVTGSYKFNYVSPGEIRLRVIEDSNGNGKWDSGNLVERRQSERAEMYVKEDGKDVFATKAYWEFEVDMDMNTVFTPVTMETLSMMLEKREQQRLIKAAEERLKQGNNNKDNEHNHNSNSNSNSNTNNNSGLGMGGSPIGGFGGGNSRR